MGPAGILLADVSSCLSSFVGLPPQERLLCPVSTSSSSFRSLQRVLLPFDFDDFLLWRLCSREQSAPVSQQRQPRSWRSRSLRTGLAATLLPLALPMCSTIDSSPSLTAAVLRLCRLFIMPRLSLASLMPNLLLPPAALSRRHPRPPSICRLFTCPRLTVPVCLPPRQHQTLFTLLLKKPEGVRDPR